MERKHLVEDKKVTFSGIFDVKELYRLMDNFFKQREYDKKENKNYEDVHEDFRNIFLDIQPYKKVSDYAQIVVQIVMNATQVEDVELVIDGQKKLLQKGTIDLTFNAYLDTDYENRWEMKPIYFFLRTVFDKFVYRRMIHKFEAEAVQTQLDVENEIMAFLNLAKFRYQ